MRGPPPARVRQTRGSPAACRPRGCRGQGIRWSTCDALLQYGPRLGSRQAGDAVHVVEFFDLFRQRLDGATRRSHMHRDLDPLGRIVGVGVHFRHREAAALDESQQPNDRAFDFLNGHPQRVVHALNSSIMTSLLWPGGTSGQTLLFGSIQTWASNGPSVSTRRRIAPSTSSRRVMRKPGTPKDFATSTKSGLSDRSTSL